jgi:hypothetical protein
LTLINQINFRVMREHECWDIVLLRVTPLVKTWDHLVLARFQHNRLGTGSIILATSYSWLSKLFSLRFQILVFLSMISPSSHHFWWLRFLQTL